MIKRGSSLGVFSPEWLLALPTHVDKLLVGRLEMGVSCLVLR